MSLQGVAELPKAIGLNRFVEFDVRYDSRENTLTVNPDSTVISGKNQLAVWNFRGLPNEWFPMVQFTKGERSDSYTGPFANLIRWNWRIVGLGNTGQLGDFEGQVSVHSAEGKEMAAQWFSLQNARPDPIAQSEVTVTLRESESGHLQLHAEPEQISTCSGSPLTWDFSQPIRYLRERGRDYWPSIVFQGDQVETPALGPFKQLCFQYDSVVGISLRSEGGAKRRFHYDIALKPYLDQEHPLIEATPSLDPIIDDEGNPPGGPGG